MNVAWAWDGIMMMLGFGLGCWKLEKKKKKITTTKGITHSFSVFFYLEFSGLARPFFFFSGYHLAYGIVLCWLGSCPIRISYDIGDVPSTWHPLFLILESQPDFL